MMTVTGKGKLNFFFLIAERQENGSVGNRRHSRSVTGV